MKTLLSILIIFLTLSIYGKTQNHIDDVYYNPSNNGEQKTDTVYVIEEHYHYYPSYENRIRNFYYFGFYYRPNFIFYSNLAWIYPNYHYWSYWNSWYFYWSPMNLWAHYFWHPHHYHHFGWRPIYYGWTYYAFNNYSIMNNNNNYYYGHRKQTGSTVNRDGVGRDIKSYQSEAVQRRERIIEKRTDRTYARPDYRNSSLEISRNNRRTDPVIQNRSERTYRSTRQENILQNRQLSTSPQRQTAPSGGGSPRR